MEKKKSKVLDEVASSLQALSKAGAPLELFAKLWKDQDLTSEVANLLLKKYVEKVAPGAPINSGYKNPLAQIINHGCMIVDYDKPLRKYIEENQYGRINGEIILDEQHYPSPTWLTGKENISFILLQPNTSMLLGEWPEKILRPGYRFPTLKEYLSFHHKHPKIVCGALVGLGCIGTSLEHADNNFAPSFLYSPLFTLDLSKKRAIDSWPLNNKIIKIGSPFYYFMLIKEKK